jgi:hypothetical protein
MGLTVFLYYGDEHHRGTCCGMIGLAEGKEPMLELIYRY